MPDIRVVQIGITGPAGSGLGTHESSSTYGHITTCTAGTRPAGPSAGKMIYETDTGRVMVYNGSAWVLVPPKIPAVKAVEGSTINVPTGLGTWVDLAPNDSDAYDSDTMHSTSSQQERVTFTTAGLYAIKCKGLWQSVASGSGSIRALDSAGAVIDETRMSFTNAAGTTNKQSLIVEDRFTAGDWIKFQVSHNNGSTITFGPFDIVAVYLGREA